MYRARKSNLLWKITVLVVIFCFALTAQAKYGGGTGGPNDPYLIYTAGQMNEIGLSGNWDDWDKHFLLMADIDLSGFTGTSFNIIGYYIRDNDYKPFTGVFDGNGHTISNFTYSSTGTNSIGVFGYVSGENAEIKNLGLIDPYVDAYIGRHVGSLVGLLQEGAINGCYVEGGSIKGDDYVGGLVGANSFYGLIRNGTITNCYSTAGVSGNLHIGGLVGLNFESTITNCSSSGSVSGERYIGGLVGEDFKGTITTCYSTAPVTGEYYTGGLVGYNVGTITNCYAIGSVDGYNYAGGLVGQNGTSSVEGAITNCYSAGNVSGSYCVGGLVGYKPGHVVASFWDIERSGQAMSVAGTGKTTAQMMMADTFVNWGSCGELWTINEGVDYPRLAREQREGEPIVGIIPFEGDGVVNNPYLIHTAQELNAIRLFPCVWDKHFKLMANIDLSQYTGTEYNIIVRFSGTFDGNGHTISNFTYISTDTCYIGLFGDVSGQIKNLGLIDPNVDAESEYYIGLLVGLLENGAITNCYVEGGSVSGHVFVGELAGFNNDGTISECYSTGSVAGGLEVGGLVGRNDNGTITNCYSTASVSGFRILGGLVGDNKDTITNCYATGSVSGNREIGGLVGYNWKATITNCYAIGRVLGIEHDVGALVGYDREGSYTKSFWDSDINPDVNGIGSTTNPNVIGESTTNIQKESTFTDAGWDFENIWWILEGAGYPRFCWEDKYGGGSGRHNDPYLIYTAEQMNTIGACQRDWDKHFKLMVDIDLGGYTGTNFKIIGTDYDTAFTGVFNGNGHTISNFTYMPTGGEYIGLFRYVGKWGANAVIKDLGLIAPDVEAGTENWGVGSLVGYLRESTITACYVEGGTVSGEWFVGALVGSNRNGTITNCYATGSVEGNSSVGGLVGYNWGTITDCYSTGSVSGDNAVGGLVGNNYGTISNCYSTGSVSATAAVGGLVGCNYENITNCYSTGSVLGSGNNVGGLVGYNWGGEVTDSFWDIETSGQTTSAGGTGLPTAEMQTISTFTDAGWDFVGETANGTEDIWFMPQQDYPHLWWEEMQVPLKLTPRTLNCRSEGNWVKAHITLPQGFTVEDVDSNRPAVLHSFGIESAPLYVFVNKNGLVQIEAAFERQVLCSLAGDWPDELTVAGFLADGSIFLGTSKVRIIHPGMNVIEELAWYWLNEDCVQPDFCNGIDMNRDSLVNLLDYALLMNIKVEFVTDE